jgi:WD40 repeat protein
MSWHPRTAGHLLTASEDTTIHFWDISSYSSGAAKEMGPARVYTGHSAWVEDVQFSPLIDSCFASVGDDRKLMMYLSNSAGILERRAFPSLISLLMRTSRKSTVSRSTQRTSMSWLPALPTRCFYLLDCCALGSAQPEASSACP